MRRDRDDYDDYGYEKNTGARYEDARRRDEYRRNKRSNVLITILIVALVAGMVFAGWKLADIFLTYHRDRSAYNDLISRAVAAPVQTARPVTLEGPEAPEEPEAPSEIPIEVDWDYLRSVNRDIVGWLYCEDTRINYPVYQRDNSYYLKHGADGSANSAGALFADISSELNEPHGNYIIYGHNMKDGSMFGELDKFIDKDYYAEHPVVYFLTPKDGAYRIELMCSSVEESAIVNFPTYFESAAAYQEYLDDITSHSFWVNYDAVTTDYEMMTLVTCAYTGGYSDPRYLVHGIMIPIQ